MTLTVRLDETLEAALERHCAETGSTKSRVMQESLAHYLMAHQARGASAQRTGTEAPAAVSALYKSFAKVGLIGSGELGCGSADKATVRARAIERIRRGSK